MWKRWKILEEFDKIFEELGGFDFEKTPGEAKYFGYQAYVGPDGVPHMKTFGNVGGLERLEHDWSNQLEAGEEESTREPYTDVIVDEKNKEVILTAEMPGIEKKDVKIQATEKELEIKAETAERKYHKKVPLGADIDPKKTHSTYNNGILEIKAPLKGPDKEEGFDVKVE